MKARWAVDLIVVLGIGLLCLPILILLLPDLDEGRTEARMAQAYRDVQRLRDSLAAETLATAEVLSDRDPWDQPYRALPLKDRGVRVVSSGPNQTSPVDGLDEDDIYSDMPASPTAAIIARKHRQLVAALGIAAGAWVLFAALYLRSRWRNSMAGAEAEAGNSLIEKKPGAGL